MASEPQSHQPAGGQPVNFQGKFSVSDAGRQHVGNVYNNHTFHYEVQSRISDEKLIKGERNQVLLKAAAEGQTERVAYLINRLGVDLDYKDEQGFTALHHAALNGREEAVASLRSAGCDVNAESFNLGTPLHQAALKGRVNVVRLLLSTESTTVCVYVHCRAFVL
jgi:ankyrin repeat protein